jgi:hypothetical protein
VDESPTIERVLLNQYSSPSSAYRSFVRYLKNIQASFSESHEALELETALFGTLRRYFECIAMNSASLAAFSIKMDFLVN